MNMINRKQLYTNQTSSRWKKVNKMRHFTVIADLNFAQKKILPYDCQKLWFCNGICNFSNLFSIKNYYF